MTRNLGRTAWNAFQARNQKMVDSPEFRRWLAVVSFGGILYMMDDVAKMLRREGDKLPRTPMVRIAVGTGLVWSTGVYPLACLPLMATIVFVECTEDARNPKKE